MTHIAFFLLAIITVVAMATQAGLGFGFAFFVAPMLLTVTSPQEAVMALLALGISINVLILVAQYPNHAVEGTLVRSLVAGALPGLPLGTWILQYSSADQLRVVVGTVILLAGLLRIRQHIPANAVASRNSGYLMGLAAGTLTTATSLNGPPVVLWMSHHTSSRKHARDSTTASLLALNLLGALVLTWLGGAERSAHGLRIALLLLPFVFLGYVIGQRALQKLNDEHWRRAALAAVLVAGATTVLVGLT